MRVVKMVVALMAVLLVTVVSACSPNGGIDGGTGANRDAATESNTSAGQEPEHQPGPEPAEPLDPVTLKIVLPGDRPADMDNVLAEAESRMKDTLNVKLDVVFVPWADIDAKTQLMLSTGEEIDLMFDAPWNHMDQMIAGGFYEPLDDLLQQYGRNILATNSQNTWDANKRDGKIMAIPLGVDNYLGFSFAVREDILQQLGNPPINSYEDLVDIAYTVREKFPDMVPYMPRTEMAATFRAFADESMDHYTNAQRIILYQVLYRKGNNGKILNQFDEMDPQLWNGILQAHKLYNDKIIYQDVLSNKDKMNFPATGKVFMTDYNDFQVTSAEQAALAKSVPGAKWKSITFFEMQPSKYPSTFAQYNFIAVPKASKHKERAIMFLDWVQSDQANYDLLAYGIEGVNWEPIGSKQYKSLTPEAYPWFPYGWIWNPKYDRLNGDFDPEFLKYYEFTYNGDNFTRDVLTGFAFDATPVQNEIAQFNTVNAKYFVGIMNGVLEPESSWEAFKEEAYAVSKTVQAELQKQVDAFLAKQQ